MGNCNHSILRQKGYFLICKYLIENSAEIDCVWVNKLETIRSPEYTPLNLAVCYGHFDIVKLLVSHGANVKRVHGLEKIIQFL